MKFVAFERTQQGTGASRRLRNTGKVPGIVYGGGDPRTVELDHNALFHALKKEAFHSSVLEMELAGKTQKVLLRDFQMHPWKQQVLHVDFQRVDDTTRLRLKVPLHYSGEENAPAVKTDKCLVSHVANEVEIECLATQLPEFIAVDLSQLVKGQSLHVSDIVAPTGVRVVRHGTLNPVIVAVTTPKAEEEETAAAAEGAAGAAPAAGAAAAPAAAAPAAAKGKAPAPAPAAKDDKKKK
ncbi:MAG: 50S ribosomal protein L25/general stress protein Ctc [Burkholderiaceae bacterium]|jgi:large subunit ribosomal protein L25|nr:50S ribosomal protein L25/general stress protein Ctc [Burkholderiaceae bacterium]